MTRTIRVLEKNPGSSSHRRDLDTMCQKHKDIKKQYETRKFGFQDAMLNYQDTKRYFNPRVKELKRQIKHANSILLKGPCYPELEVQKKKIEGELAEGENNEEQDIRMVVKKLEKVW